MSPKVALSQDESVPLLDRILALSTPEPNTGCYLWTLASHDGAGYPVMRLNWERNQIRGRWFRLVRVHRVVYFLATGSPPDGIVMHTCDQRACINPQHLRLGTSADNNRDTVAKGRHHGEYVADSLACPRCGAIRFGGECWRCAKRASQRSAYPPCACGKRRLKHGQIRCSECQHARKRPAARPFPSRLPRVSGGGFLP